MKNQWTFRRQLITLGSVLLVVLYAEILYFTDFHPGLWGILLPIGAVILFPVVMLVCHILSHCISGFAMAIIYGMYLPVRWVLRGICRISGKSSCPARQ